MNAEVTRRARARQDLISHYEFIARDNPNAAERFLDSVERELKVLLKFPGLGAVRSFSNPRLAGMRMRVVPGFRKYLIFYRPNEVGIELVRVLHGARDLPAQFTSET
jgi:toxin ParE1/3/4